MIQSGVIRSQSQKPMIRELSVMLNSSDWRAFIIHVHRKANSCADFLANLGHEFNFFFIVIDVIPPLLALYVAADARGRGCFFLFFLLNVMLEDVISPI